MFLLSFLFCCNTYFINLSNGYSILAPVCLKIGLHFPEDRSFFSGQKMPKSLDQHVAPPVEDLSSGLCYPVVPVFPDTASVLKSLRHVRDKRNKVI